VKRKQECVLSVDVSLGYPYVETFKEGYKNAMGTLYKVGIP